MLLTMEIFIKKKNKLKSDENSNIVNNNYEIADKKIEKSVAKNKTAPISSPAWCGLEMDAVVLCLGRLGVCTAFGTHLVALF